MLFLGLPVSVQILAASVQDFAASVQGPAAPVQCPAVAVQQPAVGGHVAVWCQRQTSDLPTDVWSGSTQVSFSKLYQWTDYLPPDFFLFCPFAQLQN